MASFGNEREGMASALDRMLFGGTGADPEDVFGSAASAAKPKERPKYIVVDGRLVLNQAPTEPAAVASDPDALDVEPAAWCTDSDAQQQPEQVFEAATAEEEAEEEEMELPQFTDSDDDEGALSRPKPAVMHRCDRCGTQFKSPLLKRTHQKQGCGNGPAPSSAVAKPAAAAKPLRVFLDKKPSAARAAGAAKPAVESRDQNTGANRVVRIVDDDEPVGVVLDPPAKKGSLEGSLRGFLDKKPRVASSRAAKQTAAVRQVEELKPKPKLSCVVCGEEGSHCANCSRCGKVAYCGKQHQKEHWRLHKYECQILSQHTTDGAGELTEAKAAFRALPMAADKVGELDRVVGLLRHALRLLRPTTARHLQMMAEAHFILGCALYMKNDQAECVEKLLKALEMAPTNVEWHYFTSTLPFAPKEVKQRMLDKVLELDPRDRDAHMSLQKLFIRAGDTVQASKAAARCSVAGGWWRNPLQRPMSFFTELDSKPWWEPEEVPWSAMIEASAETILNEMQSLRAEDWTTVDTELEEGKTAAEGSDEAILERGGWSKAVLLGPGSQDNTPLVKKCPFTMKMLLELDDVMECTSMAVGDVFFSKIEPGSHLKAICGPTNMRLTCHLGMQAARGCSMRVGEQTRSWQRGKGCWFDDSFEHELTHQGAQELILLVIRFWHPDIAKSDRTEYKRKSEDHIWRHANGQVPPILRVSDHKQSVERYGDMCKVFMKEEDKGSGR